MLTLSKLLLINKLPPSNCQTTATSSLPFSPIAMPIQLHTSTRLHHLPSHLLPRPPLLRSALLLPACRRPLLRREFCNHERFGVSNCTKSSSKNTVTVLVNAIDGQKINEKHEKVKRAYPFHEIEPKWQHYWEENKTFRTPDEIDTSKPKFYVLDMFPYPRYGLFYSHSFNFKLLCAKDGLWSIFF